MLRLLVRLVEVTLLCLIGYNLTTALVGLRRPPEPAVPATPRRLRVVVPAHDEAAVIGNLLADLAAQTHADRRVVVLADHCTDATPDLARAAEVEVVERFDGPKGKGPALSWYLREHPLEAAEALVVLDADNRVPADLLSRFSDELAAGHQAIQAYLDVANPDASPLATAAALSYWASNRMVQLARRNLGWTADLGGTGMCITAGALAAAGGFGSSLAEDQELGVRLFEEGHRVTWLHDLRVLDEKPVSTGVAVRQRSRWARGRSEVARRHAGRLVRMGSPAAIDLAIRLVQPSRMGVALVSAGLAAATPLGLPTLGGVLWASVAAAQVLAPIVFLGRDGVAPRYLLRYPVLTLLPILKLPARLLRQRGWYHTPHTGAQHRDDR